MLLMCNVQLYNNINYIKYCGARELLMGTHLDSHWAVMSPQSRQNSLLFVSSLLQHQYSHVMSDGVLNSVYKVVVCGACNVSQCSFIVKPTLLNFGIVWQVITRLVLSSTTTNDLIARSKSWSLLPVDYGKSYTFKNFNCLFEHNWWIIIKLTSYTRYCIFLIK